MAKNKFRNFICTGTFLILTFCILTNASQSLVLAQSGLELWFHNMVPTLLPFMILSGTLIRMGLTEGFVTLVHPILNPFFQISKQACYVIVMGFMCGFPMGAKCVCDLYRQKQLRFEEATWLLAFCNNIGPVYFVSFALPLIGCHSLYPCLFGMYGLPLLYGLLLRHTKYRNMAKENASIVSDRAPMGLLTALNEAVYASLQSILMLGGYMILFRLLLLLPVLFCPSAALYLAPLFEITSGLKQLGHQSPYYSLVTLPLGGLSCIAQTYSCISDSDLSISTYIRHKIILTVFTAVYYFLCLRFLRLW